MASLVVKLFSVLITLGGIISLGSGAELPPGCAWVDNSCQEDTEDTIIPKTEDSKSLCCTKGLYKDEEGEASGRSSTRAGCRWLGDAPFCSSEHKCHSNENSIQNSNSGDGHSCWTGHKTLCCVKPGQAYIESPEFANGLQAITDVMENYKLSECDMEQLKDLTDSLKTMKKMKDAIESGKMEFATVAGGLFHIATNIIGGYKDQYPELDKFTNIIDKTIDLGMKAYSTMKAILAAAKAPMVAISKTFADTVGAGVQAAWAGSEIAKKSIDLIRLVFPSLRGDSCTDKIEASVFADLGGGAAGGAGIGAAIGTFFFPVVGTAIGGALGGAAGSIGGLLKYALFDEQKALSFCQTLTEEAPTYNGKCKSVFAPQK